MIKIGAAPFHFWFPGVIEGLDWINCLILITWQKIAPFIILSYKINISIFITIIIILCVCVGSIGGLNQISLRKLIAYSSISHLGWIISAILIRINYWILYFSIYVLLNIAVTYIFNNQSIFHLPQTYYNNSDVLVKFSIFIRILSLGGLPPFLGFLPKWIVIQNIVESNYILLTLIIVITTLITLYFYLRVIFGAFIFINQDRRWINHNTKNRLNNIIMRISITGIPILLIISII